MLSVFRFSFLSTLLLVAVYGNGQDHIEHKGVSLSASNKYTTVSDITTIKEVNASWVAIIPYAFVASSKVIYDSEFQWSGEKTEGITKSIELAHTAGLKVMLKPHVWIRHGSYTGDFSCSNEEDWKKLENSYRNYILHFLDIAISEKVELFCVGTEWKNFIAERPVFWKSLISDVKERYTGKLTYAANWDEYSHVPFWDQLDYIGIDAYFPLSLEANPSLSKLLSSWKKVIAILQKFSLDQHKEILFTEYGFKSTLDATIKPWEDKNGSKFSEKVQDLAYKSCFETIWKESWFKGGFIWKWYHDHHKAGGNGDKDFTPQNKLAEKTIREYYGKS